MSKRVVVDANRLFCELIAKSARLRGLFASHSELTFHCPKYVLVELFKHKEQIAAATKLSEPDLLDLLNSLLQRIHFVDENAVCIGSWTEAWRSCREIDEEDAAYVALTLELDAELWTGDKQLEIGLRKKGFTRFFTPPQAKKPNGSPLPA